MYKSFISICFFNIYFLCQAQHLILSGFIYDAQSHERLSNAFVMETKSKVGVVSNDQGFYSLSVPKGQIEIQVSYLGHITHSYNLNLQRDTLLVCYLVANSAIAEITVVGQSTHLTYNATKIQAAKLSQLPVLAGEPDIMKSLQLLPGVQSTSEGQSSFSVKGGDDSQNLILLDGVPVYNSNHLFGFFSIFNERSIQDITLYKGNFPAKYGGRLSSVLDIQTKEGNTNHIAGSAAVGLLAASMDLEGPLNSKTTFFVSGRQSYLNLMATPIVRYFSGYDAASYGFYDANAKITHRFNHKNKVIVSLYRSHDFGETSSSENYNTTSVNENESVSWGNLLGSLTWNRVINSTMMVNTILHYSKYDYQSAVSNGLTDMDSYSASRSNYQTSIFDEGINSNLTWFINPTVTMHGGIGYIWQKIRPGIESSYSSNITNDGSFVNKTNVTGNLESQSQEIICYSDNDIDLSRGFYLHGGLRYTLYQNRIRYQRVEPRLNLEYKIGKMKYSACVIIANQFNHMLTSSHISQATDLWVPSTRTFGPERSLQYSLSMEYSLGTQLVVYSEAYLKTFHNLLAYQDGASYLSSSSWENMVTIGRGSSKGISLSLEKKLGRINGWITYTLSKTTRQFTEINDGASFPFDFDHRHDLKIILLQQLSARFDIGCTWVYHSGNFISYGNVMDEGEYIYIKRNAYQLPDYHRLDVNVNYHIKKNRWEQVLTLGIYNVYNRRNIYNIEFEPNQLSASTTSAYFVKQKTLFPIIPSLIYRITIN